MLIKRRKQEKGNTKFRYFSNTRLTNRENYQKRMLFEEVHKSGLALKMKRFARNDGEKYCKSVNESMHKTGTKNSEHGRLNLKREYECMNSTNENQECRTFSAFMRTKKIENPYIKRKMMIFGNTISERGKAGIYNKIKAEVTRIDKQYHKTMRQFFEKSGTLDYEPKEDASERNIKSQNQQRCKHLKTKKFTICHIVLQNFINLLAKDPSNLILKQKHSQIYKSLKKQMLQILLNVPNSQQSLKMLQSFNKAHSFEHISAFQRKVIDSTRLSKRRPHFYLINQERKDQLQMQISELIEKFEQLLSQKYKEAGIKFRY